MQIRNGKDCNLKLLNLNRDPKKNVFVFIYAHIVINPNKLDYGLNIGLDYLKLLKMKRNIPK